jgi:type IV fimbrial biogenesis protein FimT
MIGRYQRLNPGTIDQGFTLVEAVIVLTIVAILATLSVPAIMNTLTHQELSSATNSFVSQVEFARVRAAASGRSYRLRVELSDGTNCGAIHLDESSGTACTNESIAILDVRVRSFDQKCTQGESYVHIESVEPNVLGNGLVTLCFRPDGRVVRSDTGAAVEGSVGHEAGEALYVLRRYEHLSSGVPKPTALKRTVVIPYNGLVRLE